MQLATALEALRQYFGYEDFRPMQAKVIEQLYAGKDAVVLMPTGGGKSICYQIPAITQKGVGIVVSPLIALMRDQVEGLKANGIRAAFLNSSLHASDQQVVEQLLFQGEVDLLYISPEKLVSHGFSPLLKRLDICLFAVDEAHCISSWGHDFRPEYTRLAFLKRDFPQVPMVALTATADRLTRKDIVTQLQLQSPKVFLASFDRPNISLNVRPGQKRLEQILEFLSARRDQAGILYCLSRKSTEKMAIKLQRAGFRAEAYHAGLKSEERDQVQDGFINDRIDIVCATIAFGMGIDKSNIRWVIHYNLPKNVEGYYQEIGRAGRDGLPAEALLFYSFSDVNLLRDILSQGESDQMELQLAKLDRMRQYADAPTCRRKILLAYFNETMEADCGNCDNCKNPPIFVDGTVIAQKALSAVYRLRQQAPLNLVVDVLRGSGRKEIQQLGYHQIKTFGAGRDISQADWQQYLAQLINLGLLDIAYDRNQALQLNDASKEVLFEGKKVSLVQPAALRKRREEEKSRLRSRSETERQQDALFELLRQVRKQLAQEHGLPPYLIFNDVSLKEMAAKRPISDEDMLAIEGVNPRKLQRYGDLFKEEILGFVKQNVRKGAGESSRLSLELFRKHRSVEAVANERELALRTIYSHLAEAYQAGEDLDISPLISPQELSQVIALLPKMEQPFRLKPLFEALHEQISYEKIQLAIAHYHRTVSLY